MNRVTEVNKALKQRGDNVKLRRAREQYYYFDGPDVNRWASTGVYVWPASALTVAAWLETYDSMKKEHA